MKINVFQVKLYDAEIIVKPCAVLALSIDWYVTRLLPANESYTVKSKNSKANPVTGLGGL
jgi:hypothetical protein